MEYLDILDKKGNKTGEIKTREEVHAKGYWHKAVYICIINSKGEILLQRRSKDKNIFPNKLDLSVGGHPVSGENELEGLKREVLEEIGLNLNNTKLEYLFTFSNKYTDGKFIDNQYLDVYLAEMNFDINKLNLQKEEVSEVKKIYYKEFEKMLKNRNDEIVPFQKAWKKLCDILDKIYN